MNYEANKTYTMTVLFADAKGRYVNVESPEKQVFKVDIEGKLVKPPKSLSGRKVDVVCTGYAVDTPPNFMLAEKYFAGTTVQRVRGKNIGLSEGLKVEFKKSIIYSSTTNQPGKDKPFEIAREIAAFMNTEGGDLYCGVDDDGFVVGIEGDLPVLGQAPISGVNGKSDATFSYKPSLDGFSQKLRNIVRFYLGDYASTLVSDPDFNKDENTCSIYVKVHVSPSTDEFIYLGTHENVYYRTGTSAALLEGRSRERYAKKRFEHANGSEKYGHCATVAEEGFSMTQKTSRYVELPKWLDHKIFEELGASYCRCCGDMTVIDWDRAEIRKYLGTYFPRSYAESYCIFSDYLRTCKAEYASRENLSIFDFGCGTGGEILGMLDAVQQLLPHIQTVKVRALDGNQHALRSLEKIIACRNESLSPHVVLKTMPLKIDDFYDMSVIRSVISESFDFFMTFKAVCEFVTKQQFEEKNPYLHIVNTFSDTLSEGGRMLIVDVTTKNGVSREWLPKMLDKGIVESGAKVVFRNEEFNETFVVTHSHAGNDQSKVAWRILTVK